MKKWFSMPAGSIGLAVLITLLSFLASTHVSSAHGYKPTPTLTPTLTPTPTWTPVPRQPCQVREVSFDKAEYLTGEAINVTLWLDDAQDHPLVGANIDVEVTRRPFLTTQAINEPIDLDDLDDLSGSYVGRYDQTDLPGNYTFKFTANDPTGTRFLPCMAEGTVPVKPLPECTVKVTPEQNPVELNQPIVLTATVTVDGLPQNGAVVSGEVTRPDPNMPMETFSFEEVNNFYVGPYNRTNREGNYEVRVSASDSATPPRFQECAVVVQPPIKVIKPPFLCQFTDTEFDKPRFTLGEMINFKTTVSNTNGAEAGVTAAITQPNGVVITPPVMLTPTGNMMYEGSFTPVLTGSHTFKLTAADPTGQEFETCMTGERDVYVGPITPTVTIRVEPLTQTIDLCGNFGDTSSRVVVEGASNLTAIDLELSYDPKVIQVVDANRDQRGVQVGFNPSLIPSKNSVDTTQGRIFFTATAFTPLNGSQTLLTIDWLPQRGPASGEIKFERIALQNATGQVLEAATENGRIDYTIGPNCHCGQAQLQGRTDHSGIIVSNAAGTQTRTTADGFFAIQSDAALTLSFPAYLSTQADTILACQSAGIGDASTAGIVTLLVGDVTGDNRIDILDLAYIATRYQSTDPTADLNADGLVDILDLALVAGNYR